MHFSSVHINTHTYMYITHTLYIIHTCNMYTLLDSYLLQLYRILEHVVMNMESCGEKCTCNRDIWYYITMHMYKHVVWILTSCHFRGEGSDE